MKLIQTIITIYSACKHYPDLRDLSYVLMPLLPDTIATTDL